MTGSRHSTRSKPRQASTGMCQVKHDRISILQVPNVNVFRHYVFSLVIGVTATGCGDEADQAPFLEKRKLEDQCQGDRNELFLSGDPDDYIYPGQTVVTGGRWKPTVYSNDQGIVAVVIDIAGLDSGKGTEWHIEFGSRQLDAPLDVGTYTDAERPIAASPGSPGLSVSAYRRGCSEIDGEFEIHELSVEEDTVIRFSATFQQRCDGSRGTLDGCVYYEMYVDE